MCQYIHEYLTHLGLNNCQEANFMIKIQLFYYSMQLIACHAGIGWIPQDECQNIQFTKCKHIDIKLLNKRRYANCEKI